MDVMFVSRLTFRQNVSEQAGLARGKKSWLVFFVYIDHHLFTTRQSALHFVNIQSQSSQTEKALADPWMQSSSTIRASSITGGQA
ncbi:MAG: hypothetical protein CSA33_02530 [Desulfobulbus propionicus]|nr:MAG: hypothetical protein CSA33_02530 [Desulfobulbus propionicus]